MRSQPKFGPFFGVFAGLLCVFVMVTPVPGSFEDPRGGVGPAPGTPVRCLRLSYDGGDVRWLPDAIHLLPDPYVTLRAGESWYRTRGPHGTSWGWRPAGPDSVDLMGHHEPVLRLPSVGERMTGRGGWPDHVSLLDALTSHQWRVAATDVPCSTVPEDRVAP